MLQAHATPADRFFAAWLGDAGPVQREAFGAHLAEIQRALHAAWPDGPPLEVGFWAELARCVPTDREDDAVVEALARAHAVELHLAFCCRHGEPAALARFERDYIARLANAVGRIDPSPTFVDEVLQRVRMKLLVPEAGEPPKLAYYTGRGLLHSWLRVVAVREALNLRASQRRDVESADDEIRGLEPGHTDPEVRLLQQEYRTEFREALVGALAALEPSERNLLRLHYLHGLTADELGKLLAIHRSSAARRIAKIRETLLATTRRALLARIAIGPSEFADLIAVLESRWDLSIERALGSAPESCAK